MLRRPPTQIEIKIEDIVALEENLSKNIKQKVCMNYLNK